MPGLTLAPGLIVNPLPGLSEYVVREFLGDHHYHRINIAAGNGRDNRGVDDA